MRNSLIVLVLFSSISISSFAQSVVTATKTTEYADLCFFKQVQMKGYAYANIIGRCAWDPALNGMSLSLVAQPEDPSQEASRIDLAYVRDVKIVQNKSQQIQMTVAIDDMNENGDVITKTKVVYVRSTNVDLRTFSLVIK